MFNHCYGLVKWSERAISVSINFMDGPFYCSTCQRMHCICHYYETFKESHSSWCPNSPHSEQTSLLWFVSVEKSQNQFWAFHFFSTSEGWLLIVWIAGLLAWSVCVCAVCVCGVWWGRSPLTSSNNTRKTRKRSARIRAPRLCSFPVIVSASAILKKHIL